MGFSLTRTLVQALHAGDASLLETCLAYSDDALIQDTVSKLPPQLAVPLLTACVERLGRRAGGNALKGRGGGASAQRGMTLVKWVRTVLTVHSGHMLTIPDLVARLSHLHSTLTSRLELQEQLLTLSGRLDLVLAQLELRSSNAPAPLPVRKRRGERRRKVPVQSIKYVEGQSSEEEGHVGAGSEELDNEDDAGSVENIEFGGESVDDEEPSSSGDENEDDENEEEVEDEDGNNLSVGFIEDDIEESYSEGSENESE